MIVLFVTANLLGWWGRQMNRERVVGGGETERGRGSKAAKEMEGRRTHEREENICAIACIMHACTRTHLVTRLIHASAFMQTT